MPCQQGAAPQRICKWVQSVPSGENPIGDCGFDLAKVHEQLPDLLVGRSGKGRSGAGDEAVQGVLRIAHALVAAVSQHVQLGFNDRAVAVTRAVQSRRGTAGGIYRAGTGRY